MQRLHVFLSRSGVASRRRSEQLIKSGRITVNGIKIVSCGIIVGPKDEIKFNGKVIELDDKKEYFALNKPKGFLCANTDPYKRPLAVDLLTQAETRVYHVGRLDFISSGLIFFTNDGEFALQVSHPRYQVEKEYLVETYDRVSVSFLNKFRTGYHINNTTYVLSAYKFLSEINVKLVLTEGQNREIREAFSGAGIRIKKLTRIRIGSVGIDGIAEGKSRPLTFDEVNSFLRYNPVR